MSRRRFPYSGRKKRSTESREKRVHGGCAGLDGPPTVYTAIYSNQNHLRLGIYQICANGSCKQSTYSLVYIISPWAVCGPVTDSILHFCSTPSWPGSRSGPDSWARRWAQFAPQVNSMQGVKDFRVDNRVGIKRVLILQELTATESCSTSIPSYRAFRCRIEFGECIRTMHSPIFLV
jgi:hypothetical protein